MIPADHLFFSYKALQQNISITIPRAGDVFALGRAIIRILAPHKSHESLNDTSLVPIYAGTSFLFTGDAVRIAEADILEAELDPIAIALNIGHHGSDTKQNVENANGKGVIMPRSAPPAPLSAARR